MRDLKRLLAAFCVEALLAAIWIFFSPSESGRAVLLWLSPARVLLAAVTLVLWIAALATTLLIWRSPSSQEALQTRMDHFCIEQRRLGPTLIFLVVVPVLILVAALGVVLTPLEYDAYRGWAPDTFPLLHALVYAVLPILLLAITATLEFAIFLALHYRQDLQASGSWAWANVAPSLAVLLIVILTVFYWLVLVFQLRFFANAPAWYWRFEPVAFSWGDVVVLSAGLLLLAAGYWALVERRRVLAGLILLMLLGWFLQLGVGLMAGDGLSAFRDRYFSTYHKTYISKAAQGRVSLTQAIQDYEPLYGSRAFTNTKPPGLMVIYDGLDHLINGFPSSYSDAVRYERLSDLIVYAFPWLAMLLIFATYTFARRFVQRGPGLVAVIAPTLLVLSPNLILFSLFPDQAIYPILFLFGMTLTVLCIRSSSPLLAFLLGLVLYLLTFFAFTMLPLYPFAALFLLLNHWVGGRAQPSRHLLWMALAIAAGTLLLYAVFRLFFNYDFLPRFEKAVDINHNFDFYLRVGRPLPTAPESILVRLQQIAGAAWLNNLDFAAAAGFPLYVLFVISAVHLMRRLIARTAGLADAVLGSAVLSFVVLNLAGTAQGEVPRLWLFWLPTMAILAAVEIESCVERYPKIVLWLSLAQFVTLFLTFHFQDLRM